MQSKELKNNLEICVDCGLCYKVCPMMNSFGKTPKNILIDIDNGKINYDKIAYSCMLCNACTEVCPKGINLKEMFYNFRIKAYRENLKDTSKKFNLRAVKGHQNSSTSRLLTSKKNNNKVQRVFIPGCSLSGYNNEIIFKIKDYLADNLGDIELVLECCGKPSKDIGNLELFESNLKKIENNFKDKGVVEIIVACENCYKTFGSSLKDVKVITLWEVINKIGIPGELKNNYLNFNEEFALHDPCPIKKDYQIHDSVRNILKELGVKIVEFENNRDKTECCGCGGMVGVTNKELWLVQKNKRANSTDCKNIISYCESCINTFKTSDKNTLHILDLIFNEDVIKGKIKSQKSISTINQWINRIKLANKVGREN